ncbi:MAG: hypothetical protein RL385_5293 [Pseudomonadota bacterium]
MQAATAEEIRAGKEFHGAVFPSALGVGMAMCTAMPKKRA